MPQNAGMGEPGMQGTADDLIAVERPTERRKIYAMPGYYCLSGWRDEDGKPRVFECSVVKFTADLLTVAAPVKGTIGDSVSIYLAPLGKFEGPIIRTLPTGFTMRLVATYDERILLETKLAWYQNAAQRELRRHSRLVPIVSKSLLIADDGKVHECEVLDYSVSGAGIKADFIPELGQTVTLGWINGRVVRHFKGGFGIEFLLLQNSADVERLIIRPQP